MATNLINVTKTLQKLVINSRCGFSPTLIRSTDQDLTKNTIFYNPSRNTNFFNKLPASDLWKGITSVSNAGKKRGRGKNVSKSKIKDLNRGQIIGVGKANIIWPGLSAPIIRGRELVEQQQLPEDPEREKKLNQLRDQMGTFKRTKLSPIERDTFEGFDTKVLELKTVFNMKGNFGRKRRLSVLAVTGNKNGLGGFALGKGLEAKTALRKAKNRAGQNYIKTILCVMTFFTQYGQTKIYVWKKPEGHGLICHRAIKTICETIGIKDLHAKVEGSTNVGHIIKAFFLGLIRQKTPEEMAEEKKLHLVEFCKENNYFPNVIASPKECRKAEEIPKDEILDFTQYCFDGKVVLKKKKFPPFYTKLKSYELYLKRQERIRNQQAVRNNLIAEYGEIQSFLTTQYPECRQYKLPKKEEEEQT
ncbi:hypothetical protein NQ318_016344 [Aromia moschata]|uniref:Small ribosomal subunit protein uS5m n=1 Tax=Aromia moschata TaxID=1265417 RepID=A0AAV8Z399_9CUCU|nr:hypothetical protein NQ318_016344 [Aromia moschata]